MGIRMPCMSMQKRKPRQENHRLSVKAACSCYAHSSLQVRICSHGMHALSGTRFVVFARACGACNSQVTCYRELSYFNAEACCGMLCVVALVTGLLPVGGPFDTRRGR